MNKFIKKLSISALSLGLVAGTFATTASAATTTDAGTSTTVTGGSLSINDASISPFGEITLNGLIQNLTATVEPFSVVDATGTGSGWNLNIKATQLKTADGLKTLPFNSLSISTPTITAEEGSSSASVIGIGTGNIDSDTGVQLLTADTDEGMGTFGITGSSLNLNLQPKDVKAGTYASTVTFNLVTGP
ncbi:WxL domain-containing protein [Oceanobacillus damuensis]|uniref:WxL domain-containing protein n=1 Tax=Oceanobacillus damuensis TaxID=937928 RepID=UPI0008297CBF|nr:WxL domain-containing protein [Oceanobacillus damuensis]